MYDAGNWWGTQRMTCRTSLANATVPQDLFIDKRKWQFVDAPGVNFSNLNLDGACFAGSSLAGAKFINASLRDAVFTDANLTNVDFSGADLTGAHLEGATLTGVNLRAAKTLSKTYLGGLTFDAPNLSGMDMSGAQLQGGNYANWDGHTFEQLSPASINGAYMYNTKLNGANLTGAYLQHVSWFGPEATGANAIMVETHFEKADMPGLKLMSAHLQKANFTDAVLVNADLSTFTSADYNFDGTIFYQTNLKGANLTNANLRGASLYGAYIYAGTEERTATLEVLDDPEKNPNHYRFYQESYRATIAPASTAGVTSCPNNGKSAQGDCGALTSDYWKSPLPAKEPENCCLRPARPDETPDDKGMVIQCDSKRHPTVNASSNLPDCQ